MKYVNLGNSGLKVSRLCLGCMSYGAPATTPAKAGTGQHSWTLNEADSMPFLRKAIDLGVNFFDTANVYGGGASEEVLGRFIKQNVPRESVVIATKVFGTMRSDPNGGGLSRKAILFELDQSLRRLQTDYIDLYQTHYWDAGTPIDETLEALNDAVRAGKVRYLGACMPYAWQFAKSVYLADRKGWSRFVSLQAHYNLLYREEEREMLQFCRSEGLGVMCWSPLARGRLSRPWGSAQTARAATDAFSSVLYDNTDAVDKPVVDRLCEVAARHGVPPAQMALAWLYSRPGVTSPIVGATRLSHLDDAVAALELEQVAASEAKALEELYQPHKLIAF